MQKLKAEGKLSVKKTCSSVCVKKTTGHLLFHPVSLIVHQLSGKLVLVQERDFVRDDKKNVSKRCLDSRLVMHSKTENVVFIYIHLYTCVNREVGEQTSYLCCSTVVMVWLKVLKIPYSFCWKDFQRGQYGIQG